jgi:hypothetical protein
LLLDEYPSRIRPVEFSIYDDDTAISDESRSKSEMRWKQLAETRQFSSEFLSFFSQPEDVPDFLLTDTKMPNREARVISDGRLLE